jgi:penicillin-binding protein 1A
MRFVHQDIYGADGRWKPNDWFAQPAGIQKVNGELFPSWYDKNQNKANAKMIFDKVSKKKATDCTPAGAKIEVAVNKSTDPVTKADVYTAPDGYDATKNDDAHKCDDGQPTIGTISVSGGKISISAVKATFNLKEIQVSVDGTVIATLPASASGTYDTTYKFTDKNAHTIASIVTDEGYYTGTNSLQYTAP